MPQININKIADSQYHKLKHIAERKGLKVSTLCRMWIHERLLNER